MGSFDFDGFVAQLKEKWQSRPCPMCQKGPWSVGTNTFQLTEFHDGAVIIGSGPLVPVIPVTCVNCGNTVLVNALLTGSIKNPTAPLSQLSPNESDFIPNSEVDPNPGQPFMGRPTPGKDK
jgi:hypothetical protein